MHRVETSTKYADVLLHINHASKAGLQRIQIVRGEFCLRPSSAQAAMDLLSINPISAEFFETLQNQFRITSAVTCQTLPAIQSVTFNRATIILESILIPQWLLGQLSHLLGFVLTIISQCKGEQLTEFFNSESAGVKLFTPTGNDQFIIMHQ